MVVCRKGPIFTKHPVSLCFNSAISENWLLPARGSIGLPCLPRTPWVPLALLDHRHQVVGQHELQAQLSAESALTVVPRPNGPCVGDSTDVTGYFPNPWAYTNHGASFGVSSCMRCNLSFTLEETALYVLDHWISRNFTELEGPWIFLWAFSPTF